MSGQPPSALQQETISAQAQAFWRQWAEAAFPDLDSRAYFLPPVYFNRVPITTQSAAGQGCQTTPGQTGQSTPGQVGHSTPGQVGQSTPGQAGQSTPGQADQSIPGQGGQSTPGQADQSTPGPAGQSTFGQIGQSTPGHAGQSTPGQTGQSTPGQAGQSTPGQAGQATPGHAGQSTPGQAGQSTPGQAGLSTPGQAGQSNQVAMNLPACNRIAQPPTVQDGDVRDDSAMQRFLFCLQKMSEENREVLVGLIQLQFGQYLGEPCYAAAAAQLPVAKSLPTALSKHKEGDFDVLLIHRQYGIVVCEVKAFGDSIGQLNMSQQDIDKNIRSKLTEAVLQLDKAEAMLSHLVSDVTPGLRITKSIVVPNLTARQVQQAISGDPQLMQDLCRCLGTTDPADIPGLCVCSDQLSDPKTPWDVSSDVLRELGNWWQRRVAVSGPDSHMTCDNYKTLVARFCGPATTVTVPCTSPPRLCVKTLGQAESMTGEFYTAQLTLFPEQLDLLNTGRPRVFLAGPPGTGKTVVLLLKGTEWLRCGHDVHIVVTCRESHAVGSMLYHLLLEIVKTQLTSVESPGKPHLWHYDFTRQPNLLEAGEKNYLVNVLNQLVSLERNGSLYVIADEAYYRIREKWGTNTFQIFCDNLLIHVPGLHLWAASCYHGVAPADWHEEYLTRPLRSPPTIVREVEQDAEIGGEVKAYSERGVVRIYHRVRGHSGDKPLDCVTCGREVASFLHSLRGPGTVNSTTSTTVTTTPPRLQWRDMLVLLMCNYHPGLVTGLREAGIPVQVMTNDDIEDVATARSDVVWMAHGHLLHGLERKVVVCVDPCVKELFTGRLHWMSRCSSLLVIVSPDH